MAVPLLGASDELGDDVLGSGSPQEEEARIRRRQQKRGEHRDGLRRWRTLCLTGALILPIVVFVLLKLESRSDTALHLQPLAGGIVAFLELFFLLSFAVTRRRIQELNGELQLIEYDAMLLSLSKPEQIAANLFFKHQVELKQYYDQTLRLNRQVVRLGIICVLFGLLLVAGAASVVVWKDTSSTQQVVTGALGAISALLAGFVARVYLRIYAGSTDALATFHSRMVYTNRTHFANLLISGISDSDERITAVARLAATVSMEQS